MNKEKLTLELKKELENSKTKLGYLSLLTSIIEDKANVWTGRKTARNFKRVLTDNGFRIEKENDDEIKVKIDFRNTGDLSDYYFCHVKCENGMPKKDLMLEELEEQRKIYLKSIKEKETLIEDADEVIAELNEIVDIVKNFNAKTKEKYGRHLLHGLTELY